MVFKIKGGGLLVSVIAGIRSFLSFWVLCVIIGCVVSNLSKTTREYLGRLICVATALGNI